MEKKTLLSLLVIILGLSYVVYVAAVPATRSPMVRKVDSSLQDHLAKEDVVMDHLRNSTEEVFEFEMKEEAVEKEGRMMMESAADYSEPKANPAHRPKPPAAEKTLNQVHSIPPS